MNLEEEMDQLVVVFILNYLRFFVSTLAQLSRTA